MALNRKWMPSPHYSGRYGSSVRLIVVHSTEGATTIESLGNWFANPGAYVSSHTGIDNANNNTVGEYVKRGNAAWTAGNANSEAVQTELCCPSGASDNWSTAEWKNHPHMLRKCADWIAEEAKHYGIPITELSPNQAQGSGRGVCQHADLGAWGGGHHDCGNGFPMGYVLDMAKGKKPQEQVDESELEMTHLVFDNDGTSTIVVPNQYANGKSRARFGCSKNSEIYVDIPGEGMENKTLFLSFDNMAQGFEIQKDCKFMVVRRRSGTAPIAFTFSD